MKSVAYLRRWLSGLALAGVLFGCSNAPDPGPAFADKLVAAVEAGGAADPIRVIRLTDFEWDRMHVFPPMSPIKLVAESIGQSLPYDLYQLRIFERDDINLIVFLNGSTIAAAAALDRTRLDFALPEGAVALSPKQAVFEATAEGGSLAVAGMGGS